MITIQTSADTASKEEMKKEVDDAVRRFNHYLHQQGMQVTSRFEAAILREFLHVALRGLINEKNRTEIQRDDASGGPVDSSGLS